MGKKDKDLPGPMVVTVDRRRPEVRPRPPGGGCRRPDPASGRRVGGSDATLEGDVGPPTHVYVSRVPRSWTDDRPSPRRGKPCIVLISGPGPGPHNRLVQFRDGWRAVVIWRGVRRRDGAEMGQMEMFP